MCTQRSNRRTSARPQKPQPRRNSATSALALAALLSPLAAHALKADKQQNMLINSDHAKIVQNTNNNAPGMTYLTGSVTLDQGTTKARGDEATIYQHASDSKDADGKDNSGDIQRVILIGKKKQAHLEQQQDTGGLFSANSDKIDYNADTSIAVLTGNVVVNQPGRGQFKGAYMTYNTNTGEMESGDKSSSSQRVTMVIEPKSKQAADAAAKPADAAARPTTPADVTKPAGDNKKKKKGKSATPAAAAAPADATQPAPSGTKPAASDSP
jgi:lipopolysaccharide export system protein LptA